jgi:hypothetical protein
MQLLVDKIEHGLREHFAAASRVENIYSGGEQIV